MDAGPHGGGLVDRRDPGRLVLRVTFRSDVPQGPAPAGKGPPPLGSCAGQGGRRPHAGGLPARHRHPDRYWIGWHRHFGPLSGSDPKLADPLGRYAVVTFTDGTNMGPYQMSRHLRGAVSPHEISAPGNQHVTASKLNLASADVIDAFIGDDRVLGSAAKPSLVA
ncbi:MAG: Tn3 family transposase [Acidimicrobiales bacterium]